MSTETQETPEAGTEDKDPQWYRDQIAAEKAKNAEKEKEYNKLRVRLMESTFKDVGLDPSKGLGKAIAEKYDGEPDAEALRNFAISEYQWEPPASENPVTDETRAAQARVDDAIKGADSQPTAQIDLDIANAEERGDFATTMSLKLQKFRQEQGI